MLKSFAILDERLKWFGPAIEAAKRRGYQTHNLKRGRDADCLHGLGFIRPHAHPRVLRINQQQDWPAMSAALTMVQDEAQVMVYEDKGEQFRRWSHLMPDTWRFDSMEAAFAFLERPEIPHTLVAKSDVGASSRNVQILHGRGAQRAYVRDVFVEGLEVDHCSGGHERSAKSTQRDYVMFQEFIPHEFTYRVNIVGRRMAIFQRYNYPDRPVAQTGNVEPVMTLTGTHESLLEFAEAAFSTLGTRWCAIDVLWDIHRQRWVLLETSLAWPWPSPGACMDAPFFGTDLRWSQIWELMLDEYEAGVWTS